MDPEIADAYVGKFAAIGVDVECYSRPGHAELRILTVPGNRRAFVGPDIRSAELAQIVLEAATDEHWGMCMS